MLLQKFKKTNNGKTIPVAWIGNPEDKRKIQFYSIYNILIPDLKSEATGSKLLRQMESLTLNHWLFVKRIHFINQNLKQSLNLIKKFRLLKLSTSVSPHYLANIFKGRVLESLGFTSFALNNYLQAIHKKNTDPEGYVRFLNLCIKTNKPISEFITTLDLALQNCPQHPQILALRQEIQKTHNGKSNEILQPTTR